eukprot:scaffold32972_cov28-Tisochrysis_lutea.AAC.3
MLASSNKSELNWMLPAKGSPGRGVLPLKTISALAMRSMSSKKHCSTCKSSLKKPSTPDAQPPVLSHARIVW